MRFMKRVMAVVLTAALLSPMTAYADQSADALELYRKVYEKSQAATDMNAFYDFNVKMSVPADSGQGTENLEMRMEMNAKFSNVTDPANMRYMTYTRMTVPELGEITYSMYFFNNYCYMDMLGQKVRYPMDLTKIMEQAMAASGTFELSESLLKDLNMWSEGENQVLGYTIDDSRMNEYLHTVLAASGMNEMLEGMDLKLRNISGEYVVNPNNDIIKMRLKMTMDMTMEGQTITITMDGDIGIADPGQPVDVPLPNPAEYTEISAPAA
ncbi:MAG: hypothetical protein LIP16_16715 [Clostridium sp.]|nr:hypothetical protein [Clostridium sp.]